MTRTRVTAADLPCPLLWPALHNPEGARRGEHISVLPRSSSQASFSPRTGHLLAPRAPSPDSLCHYSQELCVLGVIWLLWTRGKRRGLEVLLATTAAWIRINH